MPVRPARRLAARTDEAGATIRRVRLGALVQDCGGGNADRHVACRGAWRWKVKRAPDLICLALLGLAAVPGVARADAVTDANANAGAAALAACIAPNDNPLH